MQIDANFECGNILIEQATDDETTLAIRPDSEAKFYQWFYFRATGAPGDKHTYIISNAGGASYPQAWNGYQVLSSYDEQEWFRVPTTYGEGRLTFHHTLSTERAAYAFFAPYLSDRRADLRAECEKSPLASCREYGKSLQSKPLEMVIFGDNPSAKKVWIIARQHAGEPMAEWASEGLLRRLLNPGDATAQTLLGKASFFIIPNVNPDGSALGNLRANAAGVDLNRAWEQPEPNAPEILALQQAMRESGVDYFIDIHGDEERPFIWMMRPGIPLSAEMTALHQHFEDKMADLSPALKPPPASIQSVRADDLGMAHNYVVATYRCPAWIIELPFKAIPNEENPDSLLAEGCMAVGRSCIDALNNLLA